MGFQPFLQYTCSVFLSQLTNHVYILINFLADTMFRRVFVVRKEVEHSITEYLAGHDIFLNA